MYSHTRRRERSYVVAMGYEEEQDPDRLYVGSGSPRLLRREGLRDKFLALVVFENVVAVRKLTAAWKKDFNHHRPHNSLGYLTPIELAASFCSSSRPTSRRAAELS